MRTSSIVFLLFLAVATQGQEDDACTIENISDEEWKSQHIFKTDVYKDDTSNKTLDEDTKFKTTGVEGISCKDKCYYVQAEFKDGEVVFKAGDQLAHIDKEYENKEQPSPVATQTQFSVKCSKGKEKTLTVGLNVKDKNTNAPKFSINDKAIKVPSPILKSTDILWYSGDISVTDVDFSNKKITLNAEDKDFDVMVYDSKPQQIKFALKLKSAFLYLDQAKNIKITATDESGAGDESKSSHLNLTIEQDKENSIPDVPKFTKSLYEYVYDGKSIKPKDGNIALNKEFTEDFELKIDNDNIKASMIDGKQIKLNLVETKKLPNDKEFITVTLNIQDKKNEELKEQTGVLIYIELPESTHSFTKDAYAYEYKDLKILPLTDEQVTLKAEGKGTQFSVSGECSKFIKVNLNPDSKTVKIELSNQKQFINTYKDKEAVRFTIKTVEDTNKQAEADIVIYIPKEKINFSENSFTYAYEGELTLNGEEPVSIKGSTSGITFVWKESDMSKYFENPTFDKTNKINNLKLKMDLDLQEYQDSFTLTLLAKRNDKEIGNTDVIIKISSKCYKFSKGTYKAEYVKKDKKSDGIISMTDYISNKKNTKPQIDDASLSMYFKIQLVKKNKEYTKLLKDLENTEMVKFFYRYQDLLKEEQEVKYELAATRQLNEDQLKNTFLLIPISTGGAVKATSTIILSLPNSKTPIAFPEPSYQTKYTLTDSKGSLVETIIPFDLSTYEHDRKTCTLDGDYSANFECNYDEVKQSYIISLKTELNGDALKKSFLTLTIQDTVRLDNIKHKINAALIISLPQKDSVVPSKSEECTHTGWIVMVIILAIILVAYIVASFIYHKSKLRSV